MAGVKGMHARQSTSPTYAASVAARIKAGGIVNVLQKHIVGEREMTSSQVTAALGLLRKVVPDQTKIDTTVRRGESVSEEQSRMMAEEIIERHKRATPSPNIAAGVHDSDAAGLPASAATSQDQ